MSPYVEAALISASGVLLAAGISLLGVVLTIRQTGRIDAQNRAALKEQTSELKQHLKGERP